MISRHDIYMASNARCWQPGVDHDQSDPHVIGLNISSKILVIHEKGTMFWSGIGASSYAPAEICVCSYESYKVEGDKLIFTGIENLVELPSVKKDAIEKVIEWIKN